VVHWGPLQAFFNTTDLSLQDWGLATAAAASVLVLEEARKLLLRLWGRWRGAPQPAAAVQPETPTSNRP